jgi:hypothetical protein
MSRVPPIPPENTSPKGPNPSKRNKRDQPSPGMHDSKNPDHPGQQANTEQNTTNQGYQQDR